MIKVINRQGTPALSLIKIRKSFCEKNGFIDPNFWLCFWNFSAFPS
jgi:hypothetical protein